MFQSSSNVASNKRRPSDCLAAEDIDVDLEAAISLTPNPSCYLGDSPLTQAEIQTMNIPTLFQGFEPFACSVLTWFFLTVVIPTLLFVAGDIQAESGIIIVGWCAVSLGLFICLCASSFQTLIVAGILCKPHAPPLSPAFTTKDNTTVAVKRIKVIVNPCAGVATTGPNKGRSKIDLCRAIWESQGITVDVISTAHAGHCKTLASEMNLDGVDALCAIGGDGTIHELVNGYLSRGAELREGNTRVSALVREQRGAAV